MRWSKRNLFKYLVGKPEERKQFGTPSPRQVNNIKTDLNEIGFLGCGLT
jgi:hypothetical protein